MNEEMDKIKDYFKENRCERKRTYNDREIYV